jgi:hypothetical protein
MCLKSESEWFVKNEFQKQLMIKFSGPKMSEKTQNARIFSLVVAFNPSQKYLSLIPNMVEQKDGVPGN